MDVPHSRMGFLMFVALSLLISMVLMSAGLYLYKNSLVNKVAALQESISLAKNDFQPNAITDLQTFDKRMSAANQILAGHTILSPVFEVLSSLTIPAIQFTKFNLDTGADGKNFTVRMSGLARDYKSIALQAEVFNTSSGKYFKDVVFSNLVLQTDKINKGYVGFDISFTIDPALLSYDKQILTSINSKN